jgi:ABC-type Co2+ transport system permease subunit
MSKPQVGSNVVVRVTFLILMGLVALFFNYLFLAVFVPVVGWYIWRLTDRVAELEAKLAPPGKKRDDS